MLTPSQVAQSLEIPTSTLRRWSVRFVKLMSFKHSPGQKREYSLEDLAVLKRIKELSGQGLPLASIEQTLMQEVVQADSQTSALMNLSDVAQALEFARDMIASLEAKLSDYEERVSKLEAWATSPWYKRINKRPPTER